MLAAYFADQLSRVRPLTADEVTRLLGAKEGQRRMWTVQDDRKLRRMVRKGMTAHMIATELGRTAWSVRSRIRNLKRKDKPHV